MHNAENGKQEGTANMNGIPYRFDDFGHNDVVAIADSDDNYEWVEACIVSYPSEGYVCFELRGSDGEGDPEALKRLREHLESYTVAFRCDFSKRDGFADAVRKAQAALDSFDWCVKSPS